MMDSTRFVAAPALAALLVVGALASIPQRSFASNGPAGAGAARAQSAVHSKAVARASAPPSGAGLSIEAPGVRIYRTVAADGAVTFSDHAQPGARAIQIRSFASSSDSQALETAKQQRQYWRAQSEAFALRQQARHEADEAARVEQEPRVHVIVVPHPLRAPGPAFFSPIVAPSRVSPRYLSSPGAAAGAPAAFIGSGFGAAAR